MSNALVGYTGFVGSNLINHTEWDGLFNSSNIEQIRNKNFDTVICSAARAEKWKANMDPDSDLSNIQILMNNLSTIKARKLILISTVDVYSEPIDVSEHTFIDVTKSHAYGRNRLYLERFVETYFNQYLIVRLPGLFGKGLKKNFIFDLINERSLDYTHYESVYQFYNVGYLWHDINRALKVEQPIINIATEPVSAIEVAAVCGVKDFKNSTERTPVRYDMRTEFATRFGCTGNYLYDKGSILQDIKSFYLREKR